MPQQPIRPGETVPLKLTTAERKLVLEDLLCLDKQYEAIIRNTPADKPVMMCLSDLEDLGGYIAAEANHCDSARKQNKLDAIFEKIQALLGKYTDQVERPSDCQPPTSTNARPVASRRAGQAPDVVSLKLPRTKEQHGERFLIPLTALQRESLVSCTRLRPAIERRLKEAGDGTQVIEFTARELDHMENELAQAALYIRNPHKARIVAVQKKVHDILDEARLVEFGVMRPATRRQPTSAADLLFQFKIVLLGISPSIWRRLQVRDGSLADLHDHIQAAFGWENYHLHQFEIDGERYGISADDWDFELEMKDESPVTLSQLLPKSGRRARWIYEYDFGDGWRHEVVFEGYPPVDNKTKYPLCVDGEHACPPEDIGGPWGYAEFLDAISDPNHDRHDEFMEWASSFDPKAFDARQATRELRKPIRSD